MSGEFDLIRRHFTRAVQHTVLGVGDDCAIIAPSPGCELLVSTDMLVAGTHFIAGSEPFALGWKTAAVNLSDIAAMGGQPRWITLALAMPAPDARWTSALADGFAACCEQHSVDWVGGDTTRGPLSLCATVFGEAPAGAAIRRSGAHPGDDIWISGSPGRAALGLRHLLNGQALHDDWREACLMALHQPQARVALGLSLRGLASAMLDVSDGLAGDLAHILEQSGCGACLDEAALPLTSLMQACGDRTLARECLLHGGDDYELLFTAPATARGRIEAIAGVPLNRIGHCEATPGLHLQHHDSSRSALAARGYDHFSPVTPA